MKAIFQICAGSLVLLLAGCARDANQVRSPFLRQPSFVGSSGERICALHATPLTTTNGFALSQRISGVIPVPYYVQIGSWYPNHVALGKSLRRSADYDDPEQVTYCPQCEAEYERVLELYRTQHAEVDE